MEHDTGQNYQLDLLSLVSRAGIVLVWGEDLKLTKSDLKTLDVMMDTGNHSDLIWEISDQDTMTSLLSLSINDLGPTALIFLPWLTYKTRDLNFLLCEVRSWWHGQASSLPSLIVDCCNLLSNYWLKGEHLPSLCKTTALSDQCTVEWRIMLINTSSGCFILTPSVSVSPPPPLRPGRSDQFYPIF